MKVEKLNQIKKMKELETYIKNSLEMYCFLENPKPFVPYLPSNVYIEPTNACNLECAFCARHILSRKLGYMSLADFKMIINKFVAASFQPPLTITGNGEPLLNKAIFSMIKYAKEKNLNISLISNSTFLTESNIIKLIASGLDRYQTMFDSLNKEAYEKIRYKSNYEKTKQRLINFIEKNEQVGHPIFMSLGLVKTSINKDIEKTKSFWESFPIDNFLISPLLSLQADSRLYEESVKDIDMSVYKICVVPFTDMSISYNGDVVLCPIDFNNVYVVGNVFKEELQEIWNGKHAQKLRKALLDNNLTYFSEIRHDCDKCNSPYVMYSIEDYRESIPSRMIRKFKTFHNIDKNI